MIRTIILIGLLVLMVMVARNNPGVLPEAARSAKIAIENQIQDTAASLTEKGPVRDLPKSFMPQDPQPEQVEERSLIPRGPRPATDGKAPTFIARPGPPADLPPVTPAPRAAVETAPLGTQSPSTPLPSSNSNPSPQMPTRTAAIPATPEPLEPTRQTVRIESLLRDAARILADTEIPR
jgi:hypothetical protein